MFVHLSTKIKHNMTTFIHSNSRFYTDMAFVKGSSMLFCAMAWLIMRIHAVSERMYLHGKSPVKKSLYTTSQRIISPCRGNFIKEKSCMFNKISGMVAQVPMLCLKQNTVPLNRHRNNPHQYLMTPQPKYIVGTVKQQSFNRH